MERQLDIFDFLETEEKQTPLFHYSQRVQVRQATQEDDYETLAMLQTYGKAVGVVTDAYFSHYYREHCYGLYINDLNAIVFFRESDIVGGA